MKIGFFTEGYYPQLNGVAVSVDECAKALERRGHEVYIVAPKYPGVKDKKRVIRITSIKYPENPEIRLATFLPSKSLLQASKIDFDIIHGHSGGPLTLLGWEIARLKRVPFLVTYHTLWNSYLHYILKGKIIKPKMVEVASRIFGNLCDTIVVPTQKVKEELISYGVEKPIKVIPNGIDLSRFQNGDRKWLSSRFAFDPQSKVVLYVGRLGKEKSVDYLLRAFKKLQEISTEKVLLVIVGDGVEKSRLKELAKKLRIHQSVIFTGGIDNAFLPHVYASADVFVFASRTETQGMVIIEAMAAGLPVVTVYDDAYTDMVKDGINGFLVKGSPSKFAEFVNKILTDASLREKFSQKAQEEVKKYAIDAIAEQLEILYKELRAKNSKKVDSPFRNLTKYLLLQD